MIIKRLESNNILKFKTMGVPDTIVYHVDIIDKIKKFGGCQG
jgi:hypothetical protein